MKKLDVDREFFMPNSENRKHDKQHWDYLKHIKEIIVWTDLPFSEDMKEIKYEDFDKAAKKICAEHTLTKSYKYKTQGDCLQLSLISMFLEDCTLNSQMKNEISLIFLNKSSSALTTQSI
jgi:hypothetical protein